MSFSLSPAVTVREIDLSAVISSATSTLGAFAGKFAWGPVNYPTLTSNETDLVSKFGYPDSNNAVDFFTIASFFAYTSGAWVTRIGNDQMVNANATFGSNASVDTLHILNADSYKANKTVLETVSVAARYPGAVGNALSVVACSSKDQYSLDLLDTTVTSVFSLSFQDSKNLPVRSKEIAYTLVDPNVKITDYMATGDYLVIDSVRYNIVNITDTVIVFDRIYVGLASPKSLRRFWKYAQEFARAPDSDCMHLAVIDSLGYFRQKGTVLELYQNLSLTDINAVDETNQSSFWTNAINRKSQFIYAGSVAPTITGQNAVTQHLSGGNSASATVGLDEYINAYGLYTNAELIDAPLLIGGNAITSGDVSGAVLANYLISSVAEVRKDMVAFLSVPLDAVLDNTGKEAVACVHARELLGSSSYAMIDCNWKYMYDKYNDTFVWVPCNGDIAGIYARNDAERDPWVSAAGSTKGRLKNVVKFAWNPDKTARDLLYPNDINPIFNLAIAGPVLFGDKTILGKNTALSRINVRRLMIVIEKAIATAAADLLFEFNDEFTQRRFVSMVEPYLKDAKGRRGLAAYKIIADSTVNTPQVVQNNAFVGEIYIRPLYSINTVSLSFKIVNASASFEEAIGM